MSTNKNAILRYNVLNKCFQNFGRKYFFEDLLIEVNVALQMENKDSQGIQIRQLRDDIRFMKSEAGYSAPIKTYREGKKGYYRYTDKHFSINNSPLNATEAEQLKTAISILQRFEGSPEFEWVNELAPMINDQFDLQNTSRKVMGFDANIDYAGYQNITPLFNAIVNKRVVQVQYRPFNGNEYTIQFHPYYLKQFNNRWFVFGRYEEQNNDKWNLALDRIEAITELDKPYRDDETDWEEFFYDVVGVTRSNDELERVSLKFTKEQAPYILTKPLHPSQRTQVKENGELIVTINVILNYELEMKLLAFGEKVTVLGPKSFVERISSRLNSATNNY